MLVADQLAAGILMDMDKWLNTRIAQGPGIKGLYYPLKLENYILADIDLPPGLVRSSQPDTSWFSWSQNYQFIPDANTPNKYDYYYVYLLSQDIRSSDDVKASDPIARAQTIREDRVSEFKGRQFFDAPKNIALPGADEAVELKADPKLTSRDQLEHVIVFRRANVTVVVASRYYVTAFVPQAPFVHKLVKSILGKLVGDKVAAPAPLKPLPVSSQASELPKAAVPAAVPATTGQTDDIDKSVDDIKKSTEDLANTLKGLGSLFK